VRLPVENSYPDLHRAFQIAFDICSILIDKTAYVAVLMGARHVPGARQGTFGYVVDSIRGCPKRPTRAPAARGYLLILKELGRQAGRPVRSCTGTRRTSTT
jgi:hypothetical protein